MTRDDDPVREAYARWAGQYDLDDNRTRDAALGALERLLPPVVGLDVLEIGCGTGESTRRLAWARSLVALDFSEAMMERAREKVSAETVRFVLHDVRERWPFSDASFDLVTENLVLEHVQGLEVVLREAARVLRPGGTALLFELHPYRQLAGKQARFETAEGTVRVPAFSHPVSEFVTAAIAAGFSIAGVGEWGDGGVALSPGHDGLPRVLSLSLRKAV